MANENLVGGHNQQVAPLYLTLITGGPIVLNAWNFAGARPFGTVGTMLDWEGFDTPIYVSDDIATVMNRISSATHLSFDNVLELIRQGGAGQTRQVA